MCRARRRTKGWDKLQREMLGLGDVESWLAVAEQVTIRLGEHAGGEFRRWLHETVGALQIADGQRGLLEALVGLDVPICTTGSDGLIDEVAGVDAVTWRDGPRAQMVLRGDDAGIIHLHGHWRDPSVVLGVRSYSTVLASGSAQAMLRALGTMRSLVLVGFSAGLDDPNFGALRAWMAQTWPDSEYRHYRLVSESEHEAVLADPTPDGERIQPVVYGGGHGDLEGFLRGLTIDSTSPRRRTAPDDVLGPATRFCQHRDRSSAARSGRAAGGRRPRRRATSDPRARATRHRQKRVGSGVCSRPAHHRAIRRATVLGPLRRR